MAFIKLFPPGGGAALSIAEVMERLRDEFDVVLADPDEGQDHVAGMIAVTLQFSDELPGKQERLEWLQSVQNDAVSVTFGDDLGLLANCCLMTDSELFFGNPVEVDGDARPLVDRAAAVLGYTIFDS